MSKKRYFEIIHDDIDKKELCHSVQEHICNDFCMRRKTLSKSVKRQCRVGAGIEETAGKCDTPGFPFVEKDSILLDKRGFNVLKLKRTISRRFNQSSMIACQSWRANCDIQVILYNTDPKFPDLREISNVAGYVVSYTCKGNLMMDQEKDIISSAISNMDPPCYEGKEEIMYAAKMH